MWQYTHSYKQLFTQNTDNFCIYLLFSIFNQWSSDVFVWTLNINIIIYLLKSRSTLYRTVQKYLKYWCGSVRKGQRNGKNKKKRVTTFLNFLRKKFLEFLYSLADVVPLKSVHIRPHQFYLRTPSSQDWEAFLPVVPSLHSFWLWGK